MRIDLGRFHSEEDVIVDAIRLWKGLALYWGRPNFRWSRHGHTPHVALPEGAIRGRIALPYNRVLKSRGIGPNELHELGKAALEYTMNDARYAKGKVALRIPGVDGYRSIADGIFMTIAPNVRWSNREKAYIVSTHQAARFLEAVAARLATTLQHLQEADQ